MSVFLNNPQNFLIEPYPLHQKGGQHVGVISTGIKITHIPSGLIAICNAARSQLKNRDIALNMIEVGLWDIH